MISGTVNVSFSMLSCDIRDKRGVIVQELLSLAERGYRSLRGERPRGAMGLTHAYSVTTPEVCHEEAVQQE